jgi:hypothetical protein
VRRHFRITKLHLISRREIENDGKLNKKRRMKDIRMEDREKNERHKNGRQKNEK